MDELQHDQRPEAWTAGAAGYEEAFAPVTGPYAAEAVRLLGVGSGQRVVDVAAGSGAFSLRAAGAGGEVVATDFAPGMVELLRRRFAEAGHDRCRAEVMDGQALDLDGDAFDVGASMFGMIFFPDISRGVRELARVVRPGGRLCVATWNLEGFRMMSLIGDAVAAAVPGFEAPTSEPAWARIGEAGGLAAELVGAELVDVEVHVVTRHWAAEDPAGFFRRLPAWSPTAAPLFEALDDATVERAAEAFAEAVATTHDGEGVPLQALLGLATVPR